MTILRHFILFFSLIFISILAEAQSQTPTALQRPNGQVELFAGVDLQYSCIRLNHRVYDFLINITPAIKYHPWKGSTLAVQGWVPVLNHYSDDYDYIHINMADISQEFRFGNVCLKASAGMFSKNRFGFDAKCQWEVTDWYALEVQAGLTGYWYMTNELSFSNMERLTGQITNKFYIRPYDTELRLVAGRYTYEDWGARLEWIRHFSNFLTAGAFVQWGNKYGTLNASMNSHIGGGGKLVIMLPWQGKKNKKLRVRPASNFRLSYDTNADRFAVRMYSTDPEENERDGNFEFGNWGYQKKTEDRIMMTEN